MIKEISTQFDLQKAILRKEPEIAIKFDYAKKAVNIQATGDVAWFVCATFFCISIALLLYNPFVQNFTTKISSNSYQNSSPYETPYKNDKAIIGSAAPITESQVKQVATQQKIKKIILITSFFTILICLISGGIGLILSVRKNYYEIEKRSEDKIIMKLKQPN